MKKKTKIGWHDNHCFLCGRAFLITYHGLGYEAKVGQRLKKCKECQDLGFQVCPDCYV